MRKIMMAISLFFLMTSCTTVEQVKANKELYCSGMYKGMRAVGRSALSATTGVIVEDVCDTIDKIVEEDD